MRKVCAYVHLCVYVQQGFLREVTCTKVHMCDRTYLCFSDNTDLCFAQLEDLVPGIK